jgi:hypothetical protein
VLIGSALVLLGSTRRALHLCNPAGTTADVVSRDEPGRCEVDAAAEGNWR